MENAINTVVYGQATANAKDANARNQRGNISHVHVSIWMIYIGTLRGLVDAKREDELVD